MANNYLQFSVQLDDLTSKHVEWCRKRLEELGQIDVDEYETNADFQWQLDKNEKTGKSGLWMYAEEYGNVDHVANFVQEFLKKFRPKGYFEMTWASTCSKLRLNEFSGGGVLVTAKKQYWFVPDNLIYKERQKLKLGRRSK